MIHTPNIVLGELHPCFCSREYWDTYIQFCNGIGKTADKICEESIQLCIRASDKYYEQCRKIQLLEELLDENSASRCLNRRSVKKMAPNAFFLFLI